MENQRTTTTARQTRDARVAEARALLAQVAAMVDRIEAVEDPNWCHVGDAGHVVEQLTDLLPEGVAR